MLSTGQSLGGIVGPSLAGALFAWLRVSPLFAAIVFACAALICGLRIAGAARPEHGALSGAAMIAMSTTRLVPLLLVCTALYGIGLGG